MKGAQLVTLHVLIIRLGDGEMGLIRALGVATQGKETPEPVLDFLLRLMEMRNRSIYGIGSER